METEATRDSDFAEPQSLWAEVIAVLGESVGPTAETALELKYIKLSPLKRLLSYLDPLLSDLTVSRTEPTTDVALLWTPLRMTMES